MTTTSALSSISAPTMAGSITTYCIPSFILLIGSEIAMSWIYGDIKRVYRVNDAINSVSLGMVEQTFGAMILPLMTKQYDTLYKYRLFNIPNTWSSAFGIMLFRDFLYYWAHRFAHQSNFMWAAHSIHHSSEDFNYSTALRQAAFQSLTTMWLTIYPPAIIGVPFQIYLFHASLNVVMQFWIHTRYCQDLGALEYIFNTPAQHIIHHSRAPAYCDSNYGGWFSVWDRLFGTFKLGHRPHKFGVIEQHYTWDPLLINLKNYWLLFTRMSRKKGIISKGKWLFSGNRFVYDGGIKGRELAKKIRYNPILTSKQSVYCSVLFVCSMLEYLAPLLTAKDEGYKHKLLRGMYLIFSLSSLGQFMSKTKWGTITETLRWILMIGVLGSDSLIGAGQFPLLFDDCNYNIARFLSSNVAVLCVNLHSKYKTVIGSAIVAFALWSLKNVLLFNYSDQDEDEDNHTKKDKPLYT